MDDLPRLSTSTFIGIMVAVTGNVLISLALNLQKLAHKSRKKSLANLNSRKNRAPQRMSDVDEAPDEQDEDGGHKSSTQHNAPGKAPLSPGNTIGSETETLIPFPHGSSPPNNYGAASGGAISSYSPGPSSPRKKPTIASRLVPLHSRQPEGAFRGGGGSGTTHILPVEIMSENNILQGLPTSRKKPEKTNDDSENEDENEGDYLKSKLWLVQRFIRAIYLTVA